MIKYIIPFILICISLNAQDIDSSWIAPKGYIYVEYKLQDFTVKTVEEYDDRPLAPITYDTIQVANPIQGIAPSTTVWHKFEKWAMIPPDVSYLYEPIQPKSRHQKTVVFIMLIWTTFLWIGCLIKTLIL
jgi:hypothetical protein